MLSEATTITEFPAFRPAALGVERDEAAHGQGRDKAERLGGLVLTRHLDESIMIGDEVEIRVVGIRAGTVRLKVVAPRSIAVHRREVFESIRSASDPSGPSTEARPIEPRPGKPRGGLVLARAARQSIMIGGEVELAVVEVRPSTVKLRVTAPRSVSVHRREVFESIRDGLA